MESKEELRLLKKQIRQRVLAARDSMSEQERARASLLLADRIIGHQWFYRAEKLLCFVSFGSEIDTGEIIEEALRKGKKVFVPRVEGEQMEFYRIMALEELQEGYRGIPEPDGISERYEYQPGEGEQTLMLMPGVAFDKLRHRIGYGKGFYDRYLADKEELQVHTIAIGFQCQLVEEIPSEEQDICPYQVILQ